MSKFEKLKSRGKNLYSQRVPKGLNINAKQCKHQAMLDISKESKNYVYYESRILSLCKLPNNFFSISNERIVTY